MKNTNLEWCILHPSILAVSVTGLTSVETDNVEAWMLAEPRAGTTLLCECISQPWAEDQLLLLSLLLLEEPMIISGEWEKLIHSDLMKLCKLV